MKLNFTTMPAALSASPRRTDAFWLVADCERSQTIPLSGFVALSYVAGHEVLALAKTDAAYVGLPLMLQFESWIFPVVFA